MKASGDYKSRGRDDWDIREGSMRAPRNERDSFRFPVTHKVCTKNEVTPGLVFTIVYWRDIT